MFCIFGFLGKEEKVVFWLFVIWKDFWLEMVEVKKNKVDGLDCDVFRYFWDMVCIRME